MCSYSVNHGRSIRYCLNVLMSKYVCTAQKAITPNPNPHNNFNVHGSVHRKNILIHIQQVATLHSLFYLETALHLSDGTSIHHHERKQLYPQHLVFVRPLLLPAAIAAGSSNSLTNTRCCGYSCLRSW